MRNKFPSNKFELEYEVKNFAELFKGRYGFKKFFLTSRRLSEVRRFKSSFLASFEIDFSGGKPQIVKADFNTSEYGMRGLKDDYNSDQAYRIPRLIKTPVPDLIHKIQPSGGDVVELWPRNIPRYRKQVRVSGRVYPLRENLRKPIWRRPLTYEWREADADEI